MNKINIAELLKDCPRGMELDCIMYDNAYFKQINEKDNNYPIIINIGNSKTICLTKEGCWDKFPNAKCVIFPKGKTTWDEFILPCKFKDGDILYVESNKQNKYIIIFEEIKNNYIYYHICFGYQNLSINEILCHLVDVEIIRLATEEEKQKLFNAIKDNGYRWNAETKTLVKLIEPKFKVGDVVIWKHSTITPKIIKKVQQANDRNFNYWIEGDGCIPGWCREDELQKSDRFDINTLVPFESKILVRDYDNQIWIPTFWGKYLKDSNYCYLTINGCYKYCIPYKGNEHLLGTTSDCNSFYKTWINE